MADTESQYFAFKSNEEINVLDETPAFGGIAVSGVQSENKSLGFDSPKAQAFLSVGISFFSFSKSGFPS